MPFSFPGIAFATYLAVTGRLLGRRTLLAPVPLLACAAAFLVVVDAPSRFESFKAVPAPGSQVTLSWAPEATFVVDRGEEQAV